MKCPNFVLWRNIVLKKYISEITVVALFVSLIATALVSGCAPESASDSTLFTFDSSVHTVHEGFPLDGSGIGMPETFREFDDSVRGGSSRALIVGEVAGPSINRIISGGFNHVITPILVHYVVFMGDNIPMFEVGGIINVRENYFFVTYDTQPPDRPSGAQIGDVVTNMRYVPMESGNRYLIYVGYRSLTPNNVYYYDIELFFSAMRRGLVYLLDPENPRPPRNESRAELAYSRRWQEAMEMYGHLAELPWVRQGETGLALGEMQLDISADNHSAVVSVDSANESWSVSSNQPWVTASRAGSEIALDIEENRSVERRNAMVVVSAGSIERAIVVTQEPEPRYGQVVNGAG